jgi:hypothetical protein
VLLQGLPTGCTCIEVERVIARAGEDPQFDALHVGIHFRGCHGFGFLASAPFQEQLQTLSASSYAQEKPIILVLEGSHTG